jgi:CDP-diacylglycerol---serine O-phosphatidyltransferase
MHEEKRKVPVRQKRLRRGIYFLPSILTLISMIFGFYSIIQSVRFFCFGGNSYLVHACYAVFLAMLFDGLDGRVARITQTQSEFGAQLDSLSDLVSFGLAPAFLVYFSCLNAMDRLGWLICFIFSASVALRLARFNSQGESSNCQYFRGLSSPVGAGVVVSFIWILVKNDFLEELWVGYVLVFFLISLALLMVSKLRYRSFKDFNLVGKVPFVVIVLALLVLVLLFYHPSYVVFLLFFVYALSGPLMYIWRMYLVKRIRKKR